MRIYFCFYLYMLKTMTSFGTSYSNPTQYHYSSFFNYVYNSHLQEWEVWLYFFLFIATPAAHGDSQGSGQIGATAYSSARSSTHWVGPGIEPTSSERCIHRETRAPWENDWCLAVFLLLLFFFFNFVIVDLQCSVSFCWTAEWPSHTYLYILFLILSSIMFCHKWLDIGPCAGVSSS